MTFLDPYKGVRDFYPEEERRQKHIFAAMRRAVESYGYEEMNASILEPTDLYSTKTSDEIVTTQTYTFTDRGERSVTLRPEMTPTVARMVAARKRELGFPLRWYSIQNFFRYERPQRGRLREFWQLNADLFGVSDIEADIEIISVAYRVMKELGASDDMFAIRVNSRELMRSLYEPVLKKGESLSKLFRLIDRKEKMEDGEFDKTWEGLADRPFQKATIADSPKLQMISEALAKKGINLEMSPEVVRGFDYYTDVVFEVFDTNLENKRSMFGGGRYDKLVGLYGKENVPAVGFAMGDVIAQDFLQTHGLLPALHSPVHLYLAPVSKKDTEKATNIAEELRSSGLNISLGMAHEKIGDHVKAAVKLGILHFAAYGEKEEASGKLSVKNLRTTEEALVALKDVPAHCRLA